VSDLKEFAENVINKSQTEQKFLQFIITNNKPVLTELILSELLNCQLNQKYKNMIKLSALDHIKTSGENKIFFNLNKNRTNNQFLYYDICLSTNKTSNNLYEFENKSENVLESFAIRMLDNLVCLQTDKETKQRILEENEFIKIPNNKLTKELIKRFGFDWLLKDNFKDKINYFSSSNNYYSSTQYLKNLDEGFKLLLSNYFVEFNSSRSDYSSIEDNNGLNFYGNSESFLNFFDENLQVSQIVKLNIGEQKFQEAIQKLDTLCLEKKLEINDKNKYSSFIIQYGAILL
jgi:hypothetical protein